MLKRGIWVCNLYGEHLLRHLQMKCLSVAQFHPVFQDPSTQLNLGNVQRTQHSLFSWFFWRVRNIEHALAWRYEIRGHYLRDWGWYIFFPVEFFEEFVPLAGTDWMGAIGNVSSHTCERDGWPSHQSNRPSKRKHLDKQVVIRLYLESIVKLRRILRISEKIWAFLKIFFKGIFRPTQARNGWIL